jgi:hypothetical protein
MVPLYRKTALTAKEVMERIDKLKTNSNNQAKRYIYVCNHKDFPIAPSTKQRKEKKSSRACSTNREGLKVSKSPVLQGWQEGLNS